MPLVVKDRVRETTTTLGTGTITLAGAVAGFQSFSAIGNGNTTYYTINLPGANEWEVGIGTYTASGTTLSRDTILASSNGGSAVNFSAGTKDVFCTYPAGKSAYLDASNNLLIGTTTNTNTSNIVANGTISETVSSTQYLVASQFDVGTNPNQIPLNQYLGDMAFQSSAGVSVGALTASGAVTLSGGTANGVVYLNASKVATSGSALTFDGTALAPDNTTRTLGTSSLRWGTVFATSFADGTDQLIGSSGTTVLVGYGASWIAQSFAIGGSEQMRLNSSGLEVKQSQLIGYSSFAGIGSNGLAVLGNVGIGTSSPGFKVTVSGNIAAGGTGNNGFQFHSGSPTSGNLEWWWANNQGDSNKLNLYYYSGGSFAGTAATFDKSGNLGIGTSSPVEKLHVQSSSNAIGSFRSSGASYVGVEAVNSSRSYSMLVRPDVSNALVIRDETASSNRVTLDTSGNLGLGVTPSAWTTYVAQQIGNGSIANYSPTQDMRISSNAYYQSGSWKRIASAYATQYLLDGSIGTHQWFTAASGTANDPISFTQAMTLDASGNLALGNTSVITGARADIRGANSNNLSDLDAQVLTVFDTTSYAQNVGGGIAFGYKFNSSNSYIQRAAVIKAVKENSTDGNYASAMVFATTANGASTTERARITSGGVLLVGAQSSFSGESHSFKAVGTTNNDYAAVFQQLATGANGRLLYWQLPNTNDASAYFVYATNSGGNCLNIFGNGNITNTNGSYGTISDQKLKQDIVDASSQWDDIKAIRFRKYRMKTDVAANPDAPYQLGVIAQELVQTSPGLVDEHPDMETVEVTDGEGNVTQTQQPTGTTTKTVKSSILLMKAAVALQEAMARIETLEAEVAALKGA